MKTKLLISAPLFFTQKPVSLIRPTFVFCLLSFVFINLSSQVPQGFNYQAIARDGSGNPVTGATIRVKLSVLSDSMNFYNGTGGVYVWEEEHINVKTNAFGLFTIVLGNPLATKVQGSAASFSSIDWSAAPLFIGTKIANPTTYRTMGSAQLWSVPYSMIAGNLEGSVRKLAVVGEDVTSDEALFEVKRKDGETMFAVYNHGVRVFMPLDTMSKARKGGFAIGGFSKTKGATTFQDYFVVNPDSIRGYIDTNPGKARKGGFAIGGFDKTKLGNEEYLRVTRDSTRIYINDTGGKALKGGFAIGGFDKTKGGNVNFLNVETGTTGIINPSQNRVLWYPVKNAFLAGKVLIQKPDSVGVNSFATGYESKAKGQYSQALGYMAIARGDYSTAIGRNAVAHKINSFSFGENAIARNEESYAFGRGAIADGVRSFAFGSSGIDSAGQTTGVAYAKGNYSFAIGQGSQALATGAFSIGLADTAKKDYSVAIGYKSNAGGYYSIALGNRTAALGNYSTAIGDKTIASGVSATALGAGTKASGNYSTATGLSSVASGTWSTAMGKNSIASGASSVAIGSSVTASGGNSIALGYLNTASGNISVVIGGNSVASGAGSIAIGTNDSTKGNFSNSFGFACTSIGWFSSTFGYFTRSKPYASLVIGQYNDTTCSSDGDAYWRSTDPLFICGNGSTSSRSNAFTVLKNGNIGIGVASPTTYKIQVVGGAYCNGTNWVNSSDYNLKENFEAVDGKIILGLIEKLPVKKWNYKTDSLTVKHIGPVAQDFYSMFGLGNDDKSISSVDPSGVALVAIKELSFQNKSMREQIECFKSENDNLKSRLQALQEKVENIEVQQKEIDELKSLIKTLIANQSGQGNK